MWRIFIVLLVTGLSLNHLLAQGGDASILLDGGDDWINCGTDSLDITSALTIEVWLKASSDQSNSYARILDKYDFFAQTGFNMVVEAPTSGGGIMLDFWATDGSKNSVLGNTIVDDDRWHHVALTFDGDTVKIYIDGNLDEVASVGQKTIRQSLNNLGIGNNFDGNTWFPYRGQIEEMRLWNIVRDVDQIRYWQHRQLVVAQENANDLLGHWLLNEGSGSIAHNSTDLGFDGVLTSMDTIFAWQSSTAPIASDLTTELEDLTAVWNGKPQASSSVFAISGNNLASEDVILWAHEGSGLNFDSTDVPGSAAVKQRVQRVWRAEVYGLPTVDVIFDYHSLPVANPTTLVLLADQDGIFADADTLQGTPAGDSTFVVSAAALQHGYYYTLGSTENPVAITLNGEPVLPQTARLKQNYPNPFNPSTTIEFELMAASVVTLEIFNVMGQHVVEAYRDTPLRAGTHEWKWNGTDAAGNLVASGVYHYRLQADQYSFIRKALLIR